MDPRLRGDDGRVRGDDGKACRDDGKAWLGDGQWCAGMTKRFSSKRVVQSYLKVVATGING